MTAAITLRIIAGVVAVPLSWLFWAHIYVARQRGWSVVSKISTATFAIAIVCLIAEAAGG